MPKSGRQYEMGQFMTPDDVADAMCAMVERRPVDWQVFDPGCGEGALLRAAARAMSRAGVPDLARRVSGLDLDPQMVATAQHRLAEEFQVGASAIEEGDFVERSRADLFNPPRWPGASPSVILANPPYARGREYKFFELADRHASPGTEMIFLVPLAFMDRVEGVEVVPLQGRPLGVTTGHCIVRHIAGRPYRFRSVKSNPTNRTPFTVNVGVKLYEVGGGTPPQTPETLAVKPFSSAQSRPGWLPCVRTGDIAPHSLCLDRWWVDYGPHLAHPKEISWFNGPRVFLRRVPMYGNKQLGAVFVDVPALCAGDVLVVRHEHGDRELLRGLAVFLNTPAAAEAVLLARPSVNHRMSFPKISGKDINQLFDSHLPTDAELRALSRTAE